MVNATDVAICCIEAVYPTVAPYSPGEAYPEYPFAGVTGSDEPNHAYAGVRESLRLLGLDRDRFGTPDWNPLGGIVRPGDRVVVKPNCVREFRETRAGHDDCLISHGSVIRAILDYAYIALQGKGRLVVADAPHNDADFDAVRRIMGLDELCEFYAEHATLPLEVYDLRPECARKVDGVIVGHTELPGDPAGNVAVNLGLESEFVEINDLCHLLYGSEYDMSELHRHQNGETHEYLIAKTILDADVVISLPKFKTHKKVGLTLNMKNLVGINGNKNWLPHHREGTPSQGGDQFQDNAVKRRVERAAVARFKQWFPLLGPLRGVLAGPIKAVGKRIFGDTNTDTIRSGNWYGNDTTWRMVIDLNRILHYADATGKFHDKPVRRFFSVVDGLVVGEGNGPLDPVAKAAGVILAGGNPVAVDLACARLAGFDYRAMPVMDRALRGHRRPLTSFKYESVRGRSNDPRFDRLLCEIEGPSLALKAHFGWIGHVEIGSDAAMGRKDLSPCVA